MKMRGISYISFTMFSLLGIKIQISFRGSRICNEKSQHSESKRPFMYADIDKLMKFNISKYTVIFYCHLITCISYHSVGVAGLDIKFFL